MERYTSLHLFNIVLVQRQIKSSTMQAHPIINLGKMRIKSYKVMVADYVRDSDELKVEEMPKNVLIGWFAHELGHIVDYAPHNTWQMLRFGFKYLLSSKFKKETEHSADVIAVEHGFAPEIIAAKRYILENELMGQKYKDKISKYYMSIDEVEVCSRENTVVQPSMKI